MNSLNIISARVSPPSSPVPSRSNSLSTIGGLASVLSSAGGEEEDGGRQPGAEAAAAASREKQQQKDDARGVFDSTTNSKLTAEPEDESLQSPLPPYHQEERAAAEHSSAAAPAASSSHTATSDYDDYNSDEKSPLLESQTGDPYHSKEMGVRSSSWHQIPKRFATSVINSLRWVLTTFVATPGYYLIAWLLDEEGNFAPLFQLRRLFGGGRRARKMAVEYHGEGGLEVTSEKYGGRGGSSSLAVSSGSSSSGLTSESESELEAKGLHGGKSTGGSSTTSSTRHARSKSLNPSDEVSPTRRSIRIKLHSEEAGSGRPKKHRKAQSASVSSSATAGGGLKTGDISAQLKSPTSPAGALTKYPKTPAPPRPLIPRRQPSYVNLEPSGGRSHQKTLILDLDETLIHSMSKGGRMSPGHTVEVRLSSALVGMGGQIGPQHPILYYVHKRPHCDHFLRRVCKWYNLVVFTASVQEYADPVIDWLESERKFFSARFYRQHCTFRHGAFIKDLSSVEPDLSKVVILDNSPLSYMFHQDNAIPIQGWINDPTDNDLLHLVPFLEGLQYVSDVRALLALRGGEDGQHMA